MDKQASARMQSSVQGLYHQKVGDWNITSVPAYKAENMAIFMAEARGRTARRVRQSDPELYRSAMRALSRVEMNSLLGIDESGRSKPVPLHANPDFHDGQVLIDEENRKVTIIDFGQAVPISNRQREIALDLLAVIGKATDADGVLELLTEQLGVTDSIDPNELNEVLDREDRMDRFVHLVSLVSRHGGKVPIAVVHWIMGIHRQMALGEVIGSANDKAVRNVTLMRKLGASLQDYNRMRLFRQSIKDASRHLLGQLGMGFSTGWGPAGEP
jgi:hypothetical protein